MKEAEYHELDRWGWDCPDCDHWQETEEDPAYEETLICESCDGEFIPVPG
jgi:peptide subunit release factor 1 (eRF1)